MTTRPPGRRRLRRGEGPSGADLKTLYDTGVSVRAIASALGDWPYSTVHHRLKLAGTEFRPRGGRRAPAREIYRDQPGDAE